jgi:hypothetical protein
MIYILMSMILFLFFLVIYLLVNNVKKLDQHSQKLESLEAIISSLNYKQTQLNEKLLISKEFNSSYSNEMKVIGAEIVQLQKVFLDIISNNII